MPTDPMYPHVTICLALAAVRIPIVRHRCQHRTHTKCSSTPRQWRFIIIDLSLGVSGFTDVVLSKAEASIPYRSSRGCVARERKDRHHMVTTHHTPHTAHRTPHSTTRFFPAIFTIRHYSISIILTLLCSCLSTHIKTVVGSLTMQRFFPSIRRRSPSSCIPHSSHLRLFTAVGCFREDRYFNT